VDWLSRFHNSNCHEVCGLNRDPLNLRDDLRVATLNTRTLKAKLKRGEACVLATKRRLDILCVQEHRIRIPDATSIRLLSSPSTVAGAFVMGVPNPPVTVG
jgi:hypothetical protein